MELSLAVIWPTDGAYTGLEPEKRISVSDFSSDFSGLGLCVNLQLPYNLCPEKELAFPLSQIGDFRPDRLIRNNPYLANISDASDYIAKSQSQGAPAEQIQQRLQSWPGLPIDKQVFSRDSSSKGPSESSSALSRILDMVAASEESAQPYHGLAQARSLLDKHIESVLSRVFQDPAFLHLEALWRSVHLLFKQAGPEINLTCTLLPVEADRLEEFLDSALTRLVDELPSLLLVDAALDSSAHHIRLMKKIAALGETLLLPAVCFVSPAFFHLDSWEEMDRLPYLPHYLEEPRFAKWRQLAASPAAKWLAVTCNRFVLRPPHPVQGSGAVPGLKESAPLWGSPVWALAGLLEQSLSLFGWPTHFSDWRRVKLENRDTVAAPKGHLQATETVFTDQRLQQLSRSNLIPIMGARDKDIVFAPLDRTLSGKPLSEQLFISKMSQELLLAREGYQGPLDPSGIQEHLEKHFAGIFARHGRVQPDRFQVAPEKTSSGWRTRLSISPGKAMLPTGEEFAMDLDWS